MSIVQRSAVSKVDIVYPARFLQIQFALVIAKDGVEISRRLHRTAVEPGGDVQAQMALVNKHLSDLGEEPISVDDITEISAIARLVHTPDVVQKYRSGVATYATSYASAEAQEV